MKNRQPLHTMKPSDTLNVQDTVRYDVTSKNVTNVGIYSVMFEQINMLI